VLQLDVNPSLSANVTENQQLTKDWGYFSKKDLQTHRFNLCEDCYDSMVDKFVIPMTIIDKKEAL
jgi:ribosomal-protein-alanine N-acetyltransferase